MASSSEAPIFVGGSGRCGTTVLVNTLGLHPRIFTFPDELRLLTAGNENLIDWMHSPGSRRLGDSLRQGLRGGFTSGAAFREAIRTPRRASFASRFRQLREGSFFTRPVARNAQDVGLCRAIPIEDYRRAVAQLLETFPNGTMPQRRAEVRAFMETCSAAALEESGAARWCDGTPDNVLHMIDLAAIFPGARFIHIIRNGADVARSFYRLGWSPSTTSALRRWHESVATGRAFGRTLGPEQYMEVDFDTFLDAPESTLRGVVSFLGESWSPELEAHDVRRSAVAKGEATSDPELDRLYESLARSLGESEGRSST
ncbi:MAG: sulfotransferase [Myxococcota bacterium]